MNKENEKKLDLRVQKTYSRLYSTFFELLGEKPYENITVLEICSATGVHRATFYKHFLDKQDFVNFCFNQKLKELNLPEEDSFFDFGGKTSYIDMCKRIISFISDNRRFIIELNMMNNSTAFSQALENAIADYLEKKLTYSSENSNAILSPVPLLSHFYAGAIVALLKAWAENWDAYTKDDILKFIIMRYNELEFSYRHNRSSLSL